MDDLSLCEACREKLERDLICQWDYSAWAFGVPPKKREALRQQVVKQHGEKLKLIAPDKTTGKNANQNVDSPRLS